MTEQKILTVTNPKLEKGKKENFHTFGIHLAPSTASGYNVCAFASNGCINACLNTAGRGQFVNVQTARIKKTKRFFDDRENFMMQLDKEISAEIRKAYKKNLTPAFRPNLTSDLKWEKIGFTDSNGTHWPNLMSKYPNLQTYDYTKIPIKHRQNLPFNYSLTFSLSETNDEHARAALKLGTNVAVVFNDKPKTFWGFDVINGDNTDLRFLDEKVKIVGLSTKGVAKKDTSGFVR